MAAPTEATEGLAGDSGLVDGYRSDLDRCLAQEEVELGASGVALAAFDHAGALDPADRGQQPDLVGGDQPDEMCPLRLILQDGDNGRGIDHHHHIPFSS
jgi:hypothetical protein